MLHCECLAMTRYGGRKQIASWELRPTGPTLPQCVQMLHARDIYHEGDLLTDKTRTLWSLWQKTKRAKHKPSKHKHTTI